jgi:hypothetical protein
VAWPSLLMMQHLQIHLFFVYSSFSTTGFIFLNFLLAVTNQLATVAYLTIYLVSSLALFALWYGRGGAAGANRWDQLLRGAGSGELRVYAAALLLAMGTFSPFGNFLVKYLFIFGWVELSHQYAPVLLLLLASALNSIAYFYLAYAVYAAESTPRGAADTAAAAIGGSREVPALRNAFPAAVLALVLSPILFLGEIFLLQG